MNWIKASIHEFNSTLESFKFNSLIQFNCSPWLFPSLFFLFRTLTNTIRTITITRISPICMSDSLVSHELQCPGIVRMQTTIEFISVAIFPEEHGEVSACGQVRSSDRRMMVGRASCFVKRPPCGFTEVLFDLSEGFAGLKVIYWELDFCT